MTTATMSVAVVATRLPTTDRRALSQAWYSALHMNQPGAVAPARGASHVASPPAFTPAAPVPMAPAPVSAPSLSGRQPLRASTSETLSARGPVGADRRAPETELSRRMERALERHVTAFPALRPATIAIKAGDGRVQLLVRNDGTTTRVVALCAPALRECVDRALARARFALAAAGTRIEAA